MKRINFGNLGAITLQKTGFIFRIFGTLITPDSEVDKDGCYSGGDYIPDGIMHIFYTGNILEEGNYDYVNSGRGHYTNHLSSSDGIHFSSKETLLKNEDYPSNMSCHVRDPKVNEVDGHLYLTLGARTKDSEGCVLLYECDPSNPSSLQYIQTIFPEKKTGYMWECPDLFKIDGKLLLIACPQGLNPENYAYENSYQNGWFDLEKDLNGYLHATAFHELDNGFDFYAPQTLLDNKKGVF